MDIGAKLKQRRLEVNVSVEELAKKLGVSKTTIYRYEKGEILKVPTEVLEKISKILNTNPAYFMGWSDTPTPVQTQTLQEIIVTSKQLEQPRQEKVLSFANEQLEEQNKVVSIFDKKSEETEDYITDYVEGLVAAGLGAYQEDNLHMEVKLRADDVPDEYDTIAKVAGDSMEPLIQDNDLLFIKVSSQVNMNDIGIFQVNGKNFVKKLKRDYDGAWYLQSLNNSYEEIYLSEDDSIRTIGEVVDIYREG
ncbi:helix-turn-helix domain-containing protein [Streptococcus equi]|uniref:Phage repressor protein n=1 Tax=Streptococcus equi subsp. equi (strain 4047) TaxID=553482 RepID=C0MBW9_STRE4|nr:S24 family peptidase [Streptococcus equi]QBX24129.1 CI-like repressor [Streptococcus phage Javan178]UFR16868.1 helix-turn-helix domain-containing protein [Streptococcus equi subsp. zooepidemicus]WGS35376.1 S24 family peptidase [Streptococcus equi]CAW92101.1 phage repressor protein [Streptococcus equi subsp. equi 4047]CRR07076.1 phage repressor protein [Streptococcus equi subsp. equi]